MQTLRVLCVDDESLALRRLQLQLERIADVELVGSARSVPEALAEIGRLKPDLVLLDIRLGQSDGFSVAEALTSPDAPLVIFVTAFDEFAVRAFDLAAVDYLVKPVELSRLEAAVERARTRLASADATLRVAELQAIIVDLRRHRQPAVKRYETEIWAQRLGQLVRIGTADIDWVEAERDYLHLHVRDQSYLLRETMTGLEARLDPAEFLRIRRSALVRTDRLVSIRRAGYGDYRLRMANGAELRIGRTYVKPVRARILNVGGQAASEPEPGAGG